MPTTRFLMGILAMVCSALQLRETTNQIGEFIQPYDAKVSQARRDRLELQRAGLHAKSHSQLREVVFDMDAGIAFAAGWELLERSLHSDGGGRRHVPSEHSIDWLVGFVEGKLNFPLPEWWVETLHSAHSIDGHGIVFDAPLECPYRTTDFGFQIPKDADIAVQDGFINVVSDGAAVRVDQSIVAEYRKKRALDAVLIHVDVDRIFIVLHSARCSTYHVVSLRRQSAEIEWTAEVWAAGDWVSYEGRGHHFVSLQVKGQDIYILGAGSDVLYVEAFDVTSGRNTMRFSTASLVGEVPVQEF